MPIGGGPTVTGAGAVPQAQVQDASRRQLVPFRTATLERTEILQSDAGTLTASEQIFDRTLEGTGYVFGIHLQLTALIASGNSANVAYQADAPWSAFSSVVYRDPTGEMVNLAGFSLYLANIFMGNYRTFPTDSNDTSLEYYQAVTGTGGTGGSFLINTHVPIAINRRNLLGLLGNQDRGVKYQLRTNVAASTAIYSTAPTTLQAFTINRTYESYSVPSPQGAYGPQQVVPDGFGTLHFLTQTVDSAPPAASSTVNHYMRRIGNMWRWVALVWRVDTRALGQTNVTRVSLKIGDTDVYNEPYYYRRAIMWERYGFRPPVGVACYDFIHDFLPFAGDEWGDDWMNTSQVNTAQFIVTYGSGVTGTPTLTFVTDDLALVGQPLGS